MTTITPDTTNTLFQLATDLINQSSRNVFLTGKAGTGKTTFLKYIREHCPKQMAVVAPTGVAAINAGGVTIHSFFQLPFSPYIPESQGFSKNETTVDRHHLLSRLRFNSDKRKLLRQLELLIIDEISMVRCDMLDAIDVVLRHFRKRPYEPFGGVQLLFIGDMFQLPPVIKEPEWKILADFYNSPYFFDSQVIRQNQPLYIEFDKIYRQSEEKFIRVLNQVRSNALDEESHAILESRYQSLIQRTRDDGYIILTTHNDQARNTNMLALQELEGRTVRYEATIKEDFPSNAYPAEEMLVLKEGAQVMFIRNDTGDKGKRYFNGKIGRVTKLENDKIFVEGDDGVEIEVARETWENIRYTLNKTSQTLEESVLGSFTQFPLRLAWAITIHKSQGLTFSKAIIDAGEAFAPGQVYVALSRCSSLDGMILKSRLKGSNLFTDQRIVQFSQNISSSDKLLQELEEARRHYQLKVLLSTFDLENAIIAATDLRDDVSSSISSFNPELIPWLDLLMVKLNSVQETAKKFQDWLKTQFATGTVPEDNPVLSEKLKRAVTHFTGEIDNCIREIGQSPAITDSKLHAKDYNDGLKDIFTALSLTRHLLQAFESKPFNIGEWHLQKRSFVLPAFSVNAYAGVSEKKAESPHPALFRKLKALRDNICQKKDLPIYLVAGSTSLDEMARYLPQTPHELKLVSGFGEAKVQQYGKQFLEIIIDYCENNQLGSLISDKPSKRERKQKTGPARRSGQTHAESFRLYSEGKTIAEIAKERSLTVQTIEGHLSRFVRTGEIKIEELISINKIELIRSALVGFNGPSITPIKEQLGDDISFGEIRLVMAELGISYERSAD